MVLIDINMPENCMECSIRAWESGEEVDYCPVTGYECLSIGRQDACPLKEVDDDM